ncbi:hypothetical protein M011DRAFT_206072 [Sporormia fimetaria CBS 119925]|uniref:Uncharacterized protein n=1 Tax=Sporormia fimetaria CBS 119925 TaxID=1340428 RepID=A0A6A6V1F4_9PLEO|nr:hypothetical protein M011DRAFT_206072 [Sporormia fimetaria CBS 119925]
MGSVDCYCALCTGPLRTDIRIGDKKFLAIRRKKLKRAIRNRQSGTEIGSGDESMGSGDDEDGSIEDGYNSHEERSYDPELVSEGDAKWLEETSALGFNLDAKSSNSSVFEIFGKYDDYGSFMLTRGDENAPEQMEADCYWTTNSNRIPVFPFHDVCKTVLADALGDGLLYDEDEENSDAEEVSDAEISGEESGLWAEIKKKAERIDKDSLYYAMTQLNSNESERSPAVNYGGVEGNDQSWESIPGEEYLNPLPQIPARSGKRNGYPDSRLSQQGFFQELSTRLIP